MATYHDKKNGSIKKTTYLYDAINNLEKQKAYYEGKKEIEGFLTPEEKQKKDKVLLKLKKLKTRARLITTTLLATATIATVGIGYAVYEKNINNQHTNNVVSAYTIVDKNANKYNTIDVQETVKYAQYKNDIYRYIELSNKKEKLTKEEKDEVKLLKENITENYELMDELSLEIIKTKIANVLGIEDINKIQLHNDSTQVSNDQYNRMDGISANVYISVDNNIIAQHKSFKTLSDGEESIDRNDLPRGLEDCIIEIGNAQGNPKEHSAKALKKVLNLEEKEIAPLIISYDQIKQKNERNETER